MATFSQINIFMSNFHTIFLNETLRKHIGGFVALTVSRTVFSLFADSSSFIRTLLQITDYFIVGFVFCLLVTWWVEFAWKLCIGWPSKLLGFSLSLQSDGRSNSTDLVVLH
jgi:hypothetical protein